MGEGKQQLTSTDLADRFKVSPNSIKAWVDAWERDGKISPVTRTRGGHRRFNQEHVDQIAKLLTPDSIAPSSLQTSEAPRVNS